jgi:hypothetical protein
MGPFRRNGTVRGTLKPSGCVMAEPPEKPADSTAPGQALPGAGDKPGALPRTPSAFAAELLNDAELMLGYAARNGITVDGGVLDSILRARLAHADGNLTGKTVADLIAAFTTLSAKIRPMTVASLKIAPEVSLEIVRYEKTAIVVGLVIVILSLLTFVSNSISDKIKTDVDTANDLASKLRAELGPQSGTNEPVPEESGWASQSTVPWRDAVWYGTNGIPAGLSDVDVIRDLQQFAATMRQIDGYATQLKYCLLDFSARRYVESNTNGPPRELTPGLKVRLARELTDRVEEYQQVRSLGNSAQERVTVYYGAIDSCILPVLYALLGAVAYLLRSFEDQFKSRTYIPDPPSARFLVAGIGGLVVGLFNNLTEGVTISPFAVAFLVGYAVDVFFTFLEGLLQMFKRGPANAVAPVNTPAPVTPAKPQN